MDSSSAAASPHPYSYWNGREKAESASAIDKFFARAHDSSLLQLALLLVLLSTGAVLAVHGIDYWRQVRLGRRRGNTWLVSIVAACCRVRRRKRHLLMNPAGISLAPTDCSDDSADDSPSTARVFVQLPQGEYVEAAGAMPIGPECATAGDVARVGRECALSYLATAGGMHREQHRELVVHLFTTEGAAVPAIQWPHCSAEEVGTVRVDDPQGDEHSGSSGESSGRCCHMSSHSCDRGEGSKQQESREESASRPQQCSTSVNREQ